MHRENVANRACEETRHCTVYGQHRCETRSAGRIASHTGVFPGVTRRHRVDRQQADAPAGHDRYIGIIARNRLAVQCPFDLNRRVALQHGAGSGDRVSPVRWFLADREWSYLGGD